MSQLLTTAPTSFHYNNNVTATTVKSTSRPSIIVRNGNATKPIETVHYHHHPRHYSQSQLQSYSQYQNPPFPPPPVIPEENRHGMDSRKRARMSVSSTVVSNRQSLESEANFSQPLRRKIAIATKFPHIPPIPPHPLHDQIWRSMRCTTQTHSDNLPRCKRPRPVYYCKRDKQLKIRNSLISQFNEYDAEVGRINELQVVKETFLPTSHKNACFRSLWYMSDQLQEIKMKEAHERVQQQKTKKLIVTQPGGGYSGGTVTALS